MVMPLIAMVNETFGMVSGIDHGVAVVKHGPARSSHSTIWIRVSLHGIDSAAAASSRFGARPSTAQRRPTQGAQGAPDQADDGGHGEVDRAEDGVDEEELRVSSSGPGRPPR